MVKYTIQDLEAVVDMTEGLAIFGQDNKIGVIMAVLKADANNTVTERDDGILVIDYCFMIDDGSHEMSTLYYNPDTDRYLAYDEFEEFQGYEMPDELDEFFKPEVFETTDIHETFDTTIAMKED